MQLEREKDLLMGNRLIDNVIYKATVRKEDVNNNNERIYTSVMIVKRWDFNSFYYVYNNSSPVIVWI